MTEIALSGYLICATEGETATVRRHLPLHIMLTRAEPGCVSFAVIQTEDPHIWRVDERFATAAALAEHQRRVSGSEWGLATAGIERRYRIHGDPSST